MSSNIAEKIVEKLRALPLEKREEVLKFAENLSVCIIGQSDDTRTSRISQRKRASRRRELVSYLF